MPAESQALLGWGCVQLQQLLLCLLPSPSTFPWTQLRGALFTSPGLYPAAAAADMQKYCREMEDLIVELRLFLELLDHEYLTTTVREKKTAISNILQRIQSSREFERKNHLHKTDVSCSVPAPPQMPLPEIPQPWLPPDDGPPPLPTSSLPEGYYEEAVPLSPGKAPEYITSKVCSSYAGPVDSDGQSSSSPVPKAELEKKFSTERPSSDGEGNLENGTVIPNGKELVKRKKSNKTETKSAVTKVTGKKITKIIGLGKKKPSTDEQTSSAEEDVPTCGYLNVLSNNRWRERWCRVKDNKLLFHKDRTDLKSHIVAIPLRGCEVIPGLDSKHPLTFRLLRNAQEVAVLEASSSENMGRWIGILLAGTGSSTDPGALHYDYIDVDTTANVIQTAKQSFCFMNRRVISTNPYREAPTNGYSCPSGVALHYDDVPCINGLWRPEDGFATSRNRQKGEEVLYDNAGLYDNLPSPKIFARYPPADKKANRVSTDKLSSNHYKSPVSSSLSSQSVTNTSALGRGSDGKQSQLKNKKPPATANGITSKSRITTNQQKKPNTAVNVKRTASNAEQYKYGKNRVEADAKRLQMKEEELLRRKEALRNRLAQLRKEKRDIRAAIEANSGRKSQVLLEDKLKKLEDECKQKESERVNLELELTEVKESLKKAMAGGITLGLAIEPKTSRPQSPVLRHRTMENSPISSCDTSDTECSLPVNSAAVLKRKPASNNSPIRGHVLRKAKVRWITRSVYNCSEMHLLLAVSG
ncbi:hypothetical protein FKM82_001635 [Ascaphus truei]